MTPEGFAIECARIVSEHRGHEAHRRLDFLTNDVLRELGYGEGIAIFERSVAHWHQRGDPYPYPEPCPDCCPDKRLKRDSGETQSGSTGTAKARSAKPMAPTPASEEQSNG